MASKWKHFLAWLLEADYSPTAAELAFLQGYFAGNPQAVRLQDTDGRLPLHYAAAFQAGELGIAVVRALLTIHPDSAEKKDNHGYLPLHFALTWQRVDTHAVSVITTLFNAYRRGASEKDNDGCLPLHLAVRTQNNEHALSVIAVIFGLYPAAAKEADLQACMPLHLAASHQRGPHAMSVINLLLGAYSEAAEQQDSEGRLPLHLAAQCHTGESGVALLTALLAAYPQAKETEDKNGHLPLYHAEHTANPCPQCVGLLRSAPRSVRSFDGHSPLCSRAVTPLAAAHSPARLSWEENPTVFAAGGSDSAHATTSSRSQSDGRSFGRSQRDPLSLEGTAAAIRSDGCSNSAAAAGSATPLVHRAAKKPKMGRGTEDTSKLNRASQEAEQGNLSPVPAHCAQRGQLAQAARNDLFDTGSDSDGESELLSEVQHTPRQRPNEMDDADDTDEVDDSDGEAAEVSCSSWAGSATASKGSPAASYASHACVSRPETRLFPDDDAHSAGRRAVAVPRKSDDMGAALPARPEMLDQNAEGGMDVPTAAAEGALVRCSACPVGADIYTAAAYYAHVKLVHVAQWRTGAGCPFTKEGGGQCGVVSDKHKFAVHVRTHTGEKPYTCTQCHRTFANKSNLTKHFLRLHTAKSYGCPQPQCDSAFSRKSDLTRHMRRTHTS